MGIVARAFNENRQKSMPQTAASLSNPRTTDWDRFTPSEPIPTVIDGRMYWSVRVVPNDASGISYVAFVDAKTTDVAEAETSAQISAFIAGETQVVETAETAPEGAVPTVIVKRVAPNGTVIETLEIYGNETVVIEDGE